MIKTLKIAALPLDIAWGDCAENLQAVSDVLPLLHPDTDLLVLPELFSTGFIDNEASMRDLAIRYTQLTLELLRRWCEQYNLAIAGSFIAYEDGKLLNRAFFMEPSGETTFYDKHHLFCLSPESTMLAKGEELPPVVRYRGWNVSMIVCYDIRFPVWCRNAGQRYDILLVPANWPEKRAYAWKHLLIARAIENQAVVVGANRSGHDDFGEYNGQTYIFGPMGENIAQYPGSDPAAMTTPFVYAAYSRADLAKVRKMLPVAADADTFVIKD